MDRPAGPQEDSALGDISALVQIGAAEPDPVPSPNPPAPSYED